MNNLFSPLTFLSTQDFSKMLLNPDTSLETFDWLAQNAASRDLLPHFDTSNMQKYAANKESQNNDETFSMPSLSDISEFVSNQQAFAMNPAQFAAKLPASASFSGDHSATSATASLTTQQTTTSSNKKNTKKQLKKRSEEDGDDSDFEKRSVNHSDSEDSEDDASMRNRVWSTVFTCDSFMDSANLVHIQHRTRRELPRNTVEYRLYSSLKYVVLLDADEKEFKQQVHFLMARVTVVSADTHEALETEFCVKPLNGVIESALTKQPDSGTVLKGQLVLQLSNKLSYHKHRRKFALEIRYYTPDDLENEVLTKRSPPFRVYARKPNVGKLARKNASAKGKSVVKKAGQSSTEQQQGQKRKREDLSDTSSNISTTAADGVHNKRPRRDLQGFMEKLDDLVSFMSNDLSSYDRELANTALYQRVIELNTINYNMQQQQQQQNIAPFFSAQTPSRHFLSTMQHQPNLQHQQLQQQFHPMLQAAAQLHSIPQQQQLPQQQQQLAAQLHSTISTQHQQQSDSTTSTTSFLPTGANQFF